MSASWGVAPAIARVHAYLMVRGRPLTEREVREALGLSHRAASLALRTPRTWGIVERVSEPRRVGRRGPAGTAYLAVGDHWQWFTSVIAERKVREGDPIVDVIERTTARAIEAAKEHPDDLELLRLRDWLTAFAGFVRLFDRAVGLIPSSSRASSSGACGSSARSPTRPSSASSTCSAGCPTTTSSSWSRRSAPVARRARRATKLMSGVVRTVAR